MVHKCGQRRMQGRFGSKMRMHTRGKLRRSVSLFTNPRRGGVCVFAGELSSPTRLVGRCCISGEFGHWGSEYTETTQRRSCLAYPDTQGGCCCACAGVVGEREGKWQQGTRFRIFDISHFGWFCCRVSALSWACSLTLRVLIFASAVFSHPKKQLYERARCMF